MEMEQLYDVIVIGGGPAGLTAALYLARARYRVLVVEKEHFGGQITITNEIVNYPGVAKTSGRELTDTMRQQAEGFGAEFLLAEVTAFELDGDVKTVKTGRGEYRCFGVLLATGAHPRMIGFPGEAEFRGRGIAYCATCDGEFFTGKEVFVIGGAVLTVWQGNDAFHIIHVQIAHAPLPDFSLLLQFHQSTDSLGERVTTYPMQQIEVDIVCAEPLQTPFAGTFGSFITCIAGQHFTDDKSFIATIAHGFAHKVFRTVHLGSVYQCQP